MEGQEEEVGDHVDDIDVVGVEEATAAAAAETSACTQAKRKSPRLLGAQWFRVFRASLPLHLISQLSLFMLSDIFIFIRGVRTRFCPVNSRFPRAYWL
jgi:hypothetical protein